MITHHPADDLMVALASGQLDAERALVLGVHVHACRACRRQVERAQAVGGALLSSLPPLALAHDALEKAMERIEGSTPEVRDATGLLGSLPTEARAQIPELLLDGFRAEPWRWVGPGIRHSRLRCHGSADARVFLLRIAPGRMLPRHSHAGQEFTQVLQGAFSDGRAEFGPGDFDQTDESVRHQPVVAPGGECICLAYTSAPLRFEGWLARTAARWIGL